MSETPNDDIKHPAVVYAHGGFSKDHRDWPDLKPFIEAGFIVLYPSWRSEDGNAGDFEFLYGEVEDAIAAGKYLADLPYVDSNSIYICGHSIGASITLFSAMLPSPFKKAAAMEPNIKTSYLIGDFEYFVAFDVENPKEVGIRSPLSYAESLQIPLLILHGKHDYESRGKVFFEKARKAGLDVDYKIIFGDHFTVVREGIPTAIQYFLGTAKLVNP
ncbi:alpha/beta hydrolase family protein [Leptospira koniambonensis]|uniref:alpha/beta hydrolase family protein n=1 Tax=Leptospira koniambonensis TaxID=2484950 RepID=UPI00142E68AA|nr:prolyl oligopeptidase family serine peptidase [Leptospira koniambonensis]